MTWVVSARFLAASLVTDSPKFSVSVNALVLVVRLVILSAIVNVQLVF